MSPQNFFLKIRDVIALVALVSMLFGNISLAAVHDVTGISDKTAGDGFSISDFNSILNTIKSFYRDDANGNVGIGTTSPDRPLTIYRSNASVQLSLKREETTGEYDIGADTDGLKFWSGGYESNGTPEVIFGIEGNVGIGTTSPSEKLEVSGNILATGSIKGAQIGMTNIVTGKIPYFTGTILDDTNIHYDGTNIGIGTTSPGATLDVSGIIRSSEDTYADPSSTFGSGGRISFNNTVNPYGIGIGAIDGSQYPMWFQTGSNGGGFEWYIGTSEKMRIDKAGNVGIGTNSPDTLVHIASSSAPILRVEDTGGSSARYSLKTTTQEWRIGTHASRGDNLWFYNGSDYVFDISPSGDVGIGTSSPGFPLDVQQTDANDQVLLSLREDSDGDPTPFYFELSDTGISGLNGKNLVLRGGSAVSDIAFSPSSDTAGALVIKDGGNVGIGTTSPNTKLDVSSGNIAVDPDYGIYFEGSDSDELNRLKRVAADNAIELSARQHIGMLIDSNNDDSTAAFSVAHNGTTLGSATELFRVQSNGNIGIGTTSPVSKLDVAGSMNLAAGNNLTWGGAYGAGIPTIAGSGSTLRFYPAGSTSGEKVRVDSSGNVGIGTTTPGEKLDVEGNISLGTNYKLKWNDNSYVQGTTAGNGGVWLYSGGVGPYVTQGKTGIGTTIPDAKLHIEGGATKSHHIVASSPTSHYYRHTNVASYAGGSTTPTGTIIVKLPTPLSHSMVKMRITGWSYGGNAWEVTVSGYAHPGRTPSRWEQIGGSVVRGNPPFNVSDIRLVAEEATDTFYVLLGTTTTVHENYTHVSVDVDNFYADSIADTGWDISVSATEPAFDSSATPAVSLYGSHDALISGNVGIGITSPTEKLDVAGNIAATGTICDGANNCLDTLQNTGQWTASGSDVYYSAGNVGIGTSSPARALHVEGGDNLSSMLRLVNTAPTTDNVWDISPIYNDNRLRFLDNTGAEVLSLKTGGNVGIGTASPGAPLHLYNTTSSNPQFIIENTATYRAAKFGFDTGSATGYGTGNYSLNIVNLGASNGDVGLRAANSGNVQFILKPSGNIGIGTTSPDAGLDIYDTESGYGTLHLDGQTGGILRFQTADSDVWGFLSGHTGTNKIGIYDYVADGGTGYRMVWDTNGNVGIGTTSPTQKLDVAGNIAVSGTVDGRDLSVDGTKLDGIESGATADQTAAEILTAIKTVDGSSSGLDADLLDGYQLSNIVPTHSGSDFVDGTLVITDIPATASSGDSFVIEISGKSYSGSNPPFKVIAQGYLYNDTIINHDGISYGGNFASYIKMFENNGYLNFWWPRISYWNSFSVHVRDSDGSAQNRVTSVTNSTEPTGTKKVQVDLKKSWADFNDGSGSGLDADLLDGQQGSYYATASSLSSYLPLAGGTMTGAVTFSGMSGVTGLSLGNADIVGVNSIAFNDPDEGISFGGNSYIEERDTGELRIYDPNAIHMDGNVGIGTTSPGYTLQVAGDIDATRLYVNAGGNATDPIIRVQSDTNTGLFFPADDTVAFSTGASEAMRIMSTGNVGIGTTNPGSFKLYVNGDMMVNSNDIYFSNPAAYFTNSSSGGEYVFRLADTGGTNRNVLTLDGDYGANFSYGKVGVGIASPTEALDVAGNIAATGTICDGANNCLDTLQDTGQWTSSGSNIYYNTGNVGIGVASPAKKLQVHGDIALSNGGKIGQGNGWGTDGNTYNGTLELYNGSTGYTTLQSATAYGLLLNPSGGNIGIRTTSPSAGLDVRGTDYQTGHLYVGDGTFSNPGNWDQTINLESSAHARILIEETSTGTQTALWSHTGGNAKVGTISAHDFDIMAGGTDVITATTAGNVGIKTTTPAAELHVKGTGEEIIRVDDGTDNLELGFYSGGAIIGTNDTSPLYLETSNAVRVTVDGSGNVGIGTSSPTAKLDIDDPTNSAIRVQRADSSAYSEWSYNTGTVNFGTTGGDNISFRTANTSRMWISAAGKVGIGTVSPSTALHVNGDVTATSFIGSGASLTSVNASTIGGYSPQSAVQRFGFQSASTSVGTDTGASWDDLTSPGSYNGLSKGNGTNGPGGSGAYFHPVVFDYNGTGNILQMAVPYIAGSEGLYYRSRYSSAWSAWNEIWDSGNDGSGSGLDADTIDGVDSATLLAAGKWDTATGGINYSGGNVGIGTTSPNYNLTVSPSSSGGVNIDGASNTYLLLDRNAAHSRGEMVYKTAGVTNWITGVSDSDLAGDGSEFFVGQATGGTGADLWIETNGNVGIGTTSPSSPLEVQSTDNGNGIEIDQATANSPDISASNNAYLFIQSRSSGDVQMGSNFYPTSSSGRSLGKSTNKWSAFYSSQITDTGSVVGIGTTSPKSTLSVGSNYSRGEKSVNLTSSWTTVLSVDHGGDHKSAYAKIWVGGNDWSSHSAPNFRAELFLKDGNGGYGEPGSVIQSSYWAPTSPGATADDQIEVQLTHTADNITNIQLRLVDTNGDGFAGSVSTTTQNMTFEIHGPISSIN